MIKVPEEIKNLYLTDGISKNIRISFPNGEHDDIINDNIGFNSAKFTESTCSNSDIRLGMSEANIFECELYDIPNIRGYYINVDIEIDISSLSDEFKAENGLTSPDLPFVFYRIPYGQFIVDSHRRKTGTLVSNIVAYDALALEVLHVDRKKEIQEFVTDEGYNGLKKFFYYLTPDSQYVEDVTVSEPRKDFSIKITNRQLKTNRYSDTSELRTDTKQEGSHIYARRYGTYYVTQAMLEYQEIDLSVGINSDNYKYILENFIFSNDYIAQYEQSMGQWTGGNYLPKSYWKYCPESDTVTCGRYIWLDTVRKKLYRVTGWKKYIYSNYFDSGWVSPSPMPQPDIPSDITGGTPWQTVTATNTVLDYSNCTYNEIYSSSKFLTNGFDFQLQKSLVDEMPAIYYTDIVADLAEIIGCFCRINRVTYQMDYYDITAGSDTYPSNNLYPSDYLYPRESSAHTYYRSEYSDCEYEDYLTRPIGRVYLAVKGAEYEAKVPDYDEFEYSTIEINSSNFYITNSTGNPEDYQIMLDNILGKVKGIYFRPFNGSFVALPWIESGDSIRVETVDGFFDTFIMRRTITGTQMLVDSLEALGEE